MRKFSILIMILWIFFNCLEIQKKSQAIVRLNPNYIEKTINIEVKNTSELRAFYIKTQEQIPMEIPVQIIVNIEDIANGTISSNLKKLNHFALLSAFIYLDNEDVKKEINGLKWEELKIKTTIKSGSWYQYKTGGLGFKVFKKEIITKEDENFKIIAIVFKGSDKEVGDWVSNFRDFWFSKYNHFIYDQYDQVKDIMTSLIQEISVDYPDYEIVTSGHSLGGGLAQYAAYLGKKIKNVYVFDPSPVTGYDSVDSKTRKESVKNLKIYRIYESGEFLSYPRLLIKMFTDISSIDPEVAEIKYNFLSGFPWTQHSISKFAIKLNEIHKKFQPKEDNDAKKSNIK